MRLVFLCKHLTVNIGGDINSSLLGMILHSSKGHMEKYSQHGLTTLSDRLKLTHTHTHTKKDSHMHGHGNYIYTNTTINLTTLLSITSSFAYATLKVCVGWSPEERGLRGQEELSTPWHFPPLLAFVAMT
ncbi:hypothetical protein AMECASPLE_012110 [Ameca splendens]|uniref:Uncharacterized protein n=1 Tax=Ameca splendens TaxID=208324 RepID=A0ABV0YN51_9TELE